MYVHLTRYTSDELIVVYTAKYGRSVGPDWNVVTTRLKEELVKQAGKAEEFASNPDLDIEYDYTNTEDEQMFKDCLRPVLKKAITGHYVSSKLSKKRPNQEVLKESWETALRDAFVDNEAAPHSTATSVPREPEQVRQDNCGGGTGTGAASLKSERQVSFGENDDDQEEEQVDNTFTLADINGNTVDSFISLLYDPPRSSKSPYSSSRTTHNPTWRDKLLMHSLWGQVRARYRA